MLLDEDVVVQASGVCFRYGVEEVFSDVNFCIYRNEFLGLIGPNGGGKSTLIKLILGFVKPSCGGVIVAPGLLDRVGYVPQGANLSVVFPVSALEVAEMGFLRRRAFGFRLDGVSRRRVLDVFCDLRISDIAYRSMGSLSGGERQKVLIARAVVSDPDVLLLDEPTSNVDACMQFEIYDMLKRLSQNRTVIMASHDTTLTLKHATRVLHVDRSVVVRDYSL